MSAPESSAGARARSYIESIIDFPTPQFDHLQALTGPFGLYEHAKFDRPRVDHGYTVDDNARALVVLAHSHRFGLLDGYLDIVIRGRVDGGWRNRMSETGRWVADPHDTDDTFGRALWGLGTVFAEGFEDERGAAALTAGFDFESHHLRAIAYACLGATAAAASGVIPGAEQFLETVSASLPEPRHGEWMWPEDRLTYANGRIPQAMISAGSAVGDRKLVDSGLELLGWLVEMETGANGFSFTPVRGRGPGEGRPGFDQQPVEAWAMADACLVASSVDSDPTWITGVEAAAAWFLGMNDIGEVLYDAHTGSGRDGLHPDAINHNRGAESTLAALGALQAVGSLRGTPPS